MKFKFKIQPYQTDAVENTVNVFKGQPGNAGLATYTMDKGKVAKNEPDLFERLEEDETVDDTAYRNAEIKIDDKTLKENINASQANCDIKLSSDIVRNGLGACSLDIEMETGTGKTYVYIKTIFEPNKRYGWSKFIVVVPSVAIREGVYKSFGYLEDHFMEQYKKKARVFIYNSNNLQELESFSNDAGINVMIINCQNFAKDMKATEIDAKTGKTKGTKTSLIIYSERDNFGSRRPIDVIAANNPIIIMDEPQKMEGAATQKGLKNFNPLFVLNYSATHRTQHNLVYALDALDAYQKKLVKKIEVKGFTVQNLRGTSSYLYLDSIILSKTEAPAARIEIDYKSASGAILRKSFKVHYGDDLFRTSNGLLEYKGFVVNEIDPYTNSVSFLDANSTTISKGQVIGDMSEQTIQRLQIRETIRSHFKKEVELFRLGIKCLSLFFIDEVKNYKTYDEDGVETPEFLWKTFEDEYVRVMNESTDIFEPEYMDYLRSTVPSEAHRGYFSVDKKGRSIDSEGKGADSLSDDISAYELILKNKERLLSFDEPCRFIFSHSALREGWDNPNIFQICTLRHANSATAKRQEVGRGLRICVDKDGNRMDVDALGEDRMHEINKLTVIANESYNDFVAGLQEETKKDLRERPTKAEASYFEGKIVDCNGEKHSITAQEAGMIVGYLYDNDYIDDAYNITDAYRDALANNELEPLPKKVRDMSQDVHTLIQAIFDESKSIKDMIDNGNNTETYSNVLNKNFDKEEFQELWKQINHQYAYTVHYKSEDLIKNVIDEIRTNLSVTKLRYVVTTGEQVAVDKFGSGKSDTNEEPQESLSTVVYDLVGEIARGATLTRRSVVAILKGTADKLWMFKHNPEEYIKNVIRIIKEQKATMIVDHIGYSMTDGSYDSEIFTQEKTKDISKAFKSDKHITDYVFTDGLAEKSVERTFAEALDSHNEVVVYAKLPRTFHIPTPVGNYAPDWAIAFKKGSVKHIFFVAETKGALGMELRAIEKSKISCAKKLFNEINAAQSEVRYHDVTSYDDLLDCMTKID